MGLAIRLVLVWHRGNRRVPHRRGQTPATSLPRATEKFLTLRIHRLPRPTRATVRSPSSATLADPLVLLLPPLPPLLPLRLLLMVVYLVRTRLVHLPSLVQVGVVNPQRLAISHSLVVPPLLPLPPLAPLPLQRQLVFPPMAMVSYQSQGVRRHRQWRHQATGSSRRPQQAQRDSVELDHSLPCHLKQLAMVIYRCPLM